VSGNIGINDFSLVGNHMISFYTQANCIVTGCENEFWCYF